MFIKYPVQMMKGPAIDLISSIGSIPLLALKKLKDFQAFYKDTFKASLMLSLTLSKELMR